MLPQRPDIDRSSHVSCIRSKIVCRLPMHDCQEVFLFIMECVVQLMLVTELMDGGDLRKRIRQDTAKPRKTGWYQDGRYIALGIARGLVFLHDRRTVWFDCKPSNVLLDKTGTIAKIADFGLAKVLESTYTIGYQVTSCNHVSFVSWYGQNGQHQKWKTWSAQSLPSKALRLGRPNHPKRHSVILMPRTGG